MGKIAFNVLALGLLAGCAGTHARSAQLGPACTTAEQATLSQLQQKLAEPVPTNLQQATGDTALTNELTRILTDTSSTSDLRRLAVDTAWAGQHSPQVDELLAKLGRFDRCSR